MRSNFGLNARASLTLKEIASNAVIGKRLLIFIELGILLVISDYTRQTVGFSI